MRRPPDRFSRCSFWELRARQGILGALGGNDVRRAQDLTAAKREYRHFKDAVAALERDPEKITVNTIAYPVVAEARTEAEDRMAVIGSLYKEVDGLSLLSEALNFDFKTKGMDEAYSEEELEGMSGMQAMHNRVTDVIGRTPTMRDSSTSPTARGRAGGGGQRQGHRRPTRTTVR